MIIETLVDKMIDEVLQLIKNGYKKMDQYNDFSDVYDHIMKEYQDEYGSDAFYEIFYVDAWEVRKAIKAQLDQDILTRELPSEIIADIKELLGDEQTNNFEHQIHEFVAKLISTLLCTDSYRERIKEYRRDANIGEMHDNIKAILGILQPDILELCRKSCRIPAKKYTQKLFLETEEDPNAKTVKQVYVEPFFKLYSEYEQTESNQTICELISDFLCKDDYKKSKILLILANAGMGKSTLLSKLAYEYVYQNGEINGYKKVLSIKLSDYDSTSEDPLEDMCAKLGIKDIEELDDSLLLMDAYDELRKVNRDVNDFYENLIDSVIEINCKIIITSRLNYFDFYSFNAKRRGTTVIELLPFDKIQRECWIDSYGKTISSESYLRSKLDKEDNDFFGIPIILYFVTHDDIDIQSMDSKYALYEEIFGLHAIKFRKYTPQRHRNIYKNAEDLYELMQDMSLYVFQRNTDLIVDKNKFIKTIITKNKKKWGDDESKEKAEHLNELKKLCGIVGYFNNRGNEILEYVHKSIYEFYLSVKIYNTLKQSFQAYSCNPENINNYISNISDQLRYAQLTDQTLEFIYEQIETDKSELSQMTTTITDFVYKFLLLGPKTIPSETADFLTQIKNIFFNIWKIYNKSMLLLDKGMLVSWFKNEDKKRLLLEFIRLSHYEGIELTDIHLVSAHLENAILNKAILNGTYLNGTHLNRAHLNRAHLNNAHLNNVHLDLADLNGAFLVSSVLSGAHLRRADLNGADLNHANLNDADLSEAYLNHADLRDADLKDADLSRVQLKNTDLSGADLRCAKLNGTPLIDAIFSINLKAKITLEQLGYLVEQNLALDYFEVYKDTSINCLATTDEIESIVEGKKDFRNY